MRRGGLVIAGVALGIAGSAAAQAPPRAPEAVQSAFDTRVLQSLAANRALRGPMEGGWRLVGAQGEPLYDIELSEDREGLGGAWRDLRRPGALDASGLLDGARDGGRLSLQLSATAVVRLQAAAGGVWSGELDEAGQSQPVKLERSGL